jgi:predicted AlkP superfamily phosphohydrolase/phosphomutase
VRVLILGFDAFDPSRFEQLSAQGKLPNLTRYAEAGGYARFGVTDPPQSEVSWTSIATGLNPGGHGIFDFVHRDAATHTLSVSLLPTKRGIGGTQFVPPFTATTLFDQAVREGYPATMLWWPATFPARPESPVRTLPGLGTPDIQGRLGLGTLLSTEDQADDETRKTPFEPLEQRRKGSYSGVLKGPVRKQRKGDRESTIELKLDLVGDGAARLTLGKQRVDLVEGKWSPILEVSFKMGPLMSVRAITRAILTQVDPEVRLYFLPLQLHPLHSPWRYASPRSLVKETWTECGPFLTLGWQQDTTGLEEGCMTDEQFLDLCDSILALRTRVLGQQLGHFREGVLASVFDSLDRIQHMFWRDRPDILEAWYVKLDTLLGDVEQYLNDQGGERTKIIILSDHGFADFDYKIHLNRWLIDRGYLVTKEGNGSGSLRDVDWSRSRAYAVGLNSLYVNREGREGKGCVPEGEYAAVVETLRAELQDWQGPDGRAVVRRALGQEDAFVGPLAEYGPDLVVGYSSGYRASSDTGLGKWEETAIEANRDHWGADHCMDAQVVPGVLFCNQGLREFPNPSYRDVPRLATGMEPDSSGAAPPAEYSEEDEEIIEERLRGLGYL